MNFEFTIIVPVYNEQANLERVEETFNNYFKIAPLSTKVLFVNDGSSDNSQQLIEQICSRSSNFGYITFEKTCGLSAAIKAGFDHVHTPFLGYIDADL